MQYSPKLKKAMKELKAIAKKYDIAAAFVIHAPGFTEHGTHLMPSHSCLKWEGKVVRLRATADDFRGDTNARDEMVENTSDMLRGIGHVGMMQSLGIMKISEQLDKVIGKPPPDFEHYPNTEFDN